MEGARCYRAVTGRPFAGDGGGSRAVVGRAYPDGNWEEFSRSEVTSGGARYWSTRGGRWSVPPAAGPWGSMEGRLQGEVLLTAGMPALGQR